MNGNVFNLLFFFLSFSLSVFLTLFLSSSLSLDNDNSEAISATVLFFWSSAGLSFLAKILDLSSTIDFIEANSCWTLLDLFYFQLNFLFGLRIKPIFYYKLHI